MQKLFKDTRTLDERARKNYSLTEDIMMENAAAALEKECLAHIFDSRSLYMARPVVLILAGSGNNGADGYALARRLVSHDCAVYVCAVFEPKSQMCILQKERAQKCGVHFLSIYDLDDFLENKSFDMRVIADCIFGSGFHGELPVEAQAVIEQANIQDAFKIACDIPTGLDCNGNIHSAAFCADTTISMGALKIALYSDDAKDVCGTIRTCNLGVAQNNFETEECDAWLLEAQDLKLPIRTKKSCNKGTFGHTAIIAGEKSGAALIAAKAALNFGSGLVTVIDEAQNCKNVPCEIMKTSSFLQNATAVALGMGLGECKTFFDELCKTNIPCVLDADVFYKKETAEFLKLRSSQKAATVVTPHPKEFAELLNVCGLGNFTTKEAVEHRVELAQKFCNTFKNIVLILKGANILICHTNERDEFKLYINPLGSAALAKGGSGDVLSGMTAALLAQKKTAIEAAVHASLAHALAGASHKTNYALTPQSLIKAVATLNEKK